MDNVVIIDYGAGNVKSVEFALRRLGANVLLTSDKEAIVSASKVVFPGVGHARPAMLSLKASGLDLIIPELKVPVLGICLGMQLMCIQTEEGNTKGLGIFDTSVKKFPAAAKIPHMGWNTFQRLRGALFEGIEEGVYCYFVHSYYAEACNMTSSTCDYILPFSATLERDNFYGCQFHPEKSGAVGEQLLLNFLKL